MTTHSTTDTVRGNTFLTGKQGFEHRRPVWVCTALAICLMIAAAGCQTPPAVSAGAPAPGQAQTATQPEVLTLREGDVLKIAFPGTPSLDTTQPIRRDGKITLPMVGELAVVGMAPTDLEKELVKLYAPQLVSKEVAVTVVSSSFSVFVSGAVLRPGKIESDHRLTALEAIMEAGGFDYTKANTQGVVVIRSEGGRTHNYTINLKLVLEGTQNEPFYLKPSDIVYVPEKFSWF
jgi:polysaccharide export outer membrane protein